MTYDEIFEHIGETYNFDTYIELNNVLSMNYFLDEIAEVPNEAIVIYDGTQVILQHPSYNFKVQLDSGGRGDFYSHKIDINIDEESVRGRF